MQVKIEGLEDEVRRIIADVLTEAEGDPWLDSGEAAQYLSTTPGQIRNLVSAGKLPRHGAPGTKLLFRRSELAAYAFMQGYALEKSRLEAGR